MPNVGSSGSFLFPCGSLHVHMVASGSLFLPHSPLLCLRDTRKIPALITLPMCPYIPLDPYQNYLYPPYAVRNAHIGCPVTPLSCPWLHAYTPQGLTILLIISDFSMYPTQLLNLYPLPTKQYNIDKAERRLSKMEASTWYGGGVLMFLKCCNLYPVVLWAQLMFRRP